MSFWKTSNLQTFVSLGGNSCRPAITSRTFVSIAVNLTGPEWDICQGLPQLCLRKCRGSASAASRKSLSRSSPETSEQHWIITNREQSVHHCFIKTIMGAISENGASVYKFFWNNNPFPSSLFQVLFASFFIFSSSANIVQIDGLAPLTVSLPCFSIQSKHTIYKNMNSVQQQCEHHH